MLQCGHHPVRLGPCEVGDVDPLICHALSLDPWTGLVAGADNIDGLDVIRSGGMKQLFGGVYACATLGIFLREFTYGHVRQLAAVLRRFLIALAQRTPVLTGIDRRCYLDIDSLLR